MYTTPPTGGQRTPPPLIVRPEARGGRVVADDDDPLSFLFHSVIAAGMVSMLLLHRYAYDVYELTTQEDHAVEWASVVCYLSAGVLGMRHALWRRRMPFDALVALHCLFVGGEEFSWGQRLAGFKPPKLFLAENLQQEVSLHNFYGPDAHDAVFALAVLGYGALLPLLARGDRTRRLLERLGATAPPARFAPWCVFLVALYAWNPLHLSGEWVETVVAAMFLAGAALLARPRLGARQVLAGLLLIVASGVALTEVSNAHERGGNPERVACARAEAEALLKDIVEGSAARQKLLDIERSLHRRIRVAAESGYLDAGRFSRLGSVRCGPPAEEDAATRRRYAVDPWGLSYWFFVAKFDDGARALTIYSFGPNRRRDSDEGAPGRGSSIGDDDISATAVLNEATIPLPAPE